MNSNLDFYLSFDGLVFHPMDVFIAADWPLCTKNQFTRKVKTVTEIKTKKGKKQKQRRVSVCLFVCLVINAILRSTRKTYWDETWCEDSVGHEGGS